MVGSLNDVFVFMFYFLCFSPAQHHAFPVPQQVADGGDAVSRDLPNPGGKPAHQFHLEEEWSANPVAAQRQDWSKFLISSHPVSIALANRAFLGICRLKITAKCHICEH